MLKVEKNENNVSKCLCPGCPTYNDCAREKNEKLFCAEALAGRTCSYEMNGCVCGDCPVHKENNLTALYYCAHGSAEEIR